MLIGWAASFDPKSALLGRSWVASELRIVPETGFVSSSGASLDDGDKGKASGPALTIERARDALERTAGLVHVEGGGAP